MRRRNREVSRATSFRRVRVDGASGTDDGPGRAFSFNEADGMSADGLQSNLGLVAGRVLRSDDEWVRRCLETVVQSVSSVNKWKERTLF
jgi:hypothetical protein